MYVWVYIHGATIINISFFLFLPCFHYYSLSIKSWTLLKDRSIYQVKMHGEKKVENAIKRDKNIKQVICTLCPRYILKMKLNRFLLTICSHSTNNATYVRVQTLLCICSYLIIYNFSEIAGACVFVEFL